MNNIKDGGMPEQIWAVTSSITQKTGHYTVIEPYDGGELYIRADIHQRKLEEVKAEQSAELKRIREALQEIATATTGEGYCFDSLKEIAQEAMPKVRSSGNE